MQAITIAYGACLIALGIAGYFATGMVSITAMIPAFFGIPVLLLGLVSLKENLRMHAMHAVVLIGILAFLGALRGIPGAIALITGGEVERPAAAISQGLMAVLSLAFVILCINSFIQARRNRQKAQANAELS